MTDASLNSRGPMAAVEARCTAILRSPLAQKHPAVAARLAFRSRLSVAEAGEVLDMLDTPAPAAYRRPASAGGGPLRFADVLGVSAPVNRPTPAMTARDIIATAERLGTARR